MQWFSQLALCHAMSSSIIWKRSSSTWTDEFSWDEYVKPHMTETPFIISLKSNLSHNTFLVLLKDGNFMIKQYFSNPCFKNTAVPPEFRHACVCLSWTTVNGSVNPSIVRISLRSVQVSTKHIMLKGITKLLKNVLCSSSLDFSPDLFHTPNLK